MLNITYRDLINDSLKLAETLKRVASEYDSVFGIPSGGILPAFIVAQELKLPLLDIPHRDFGQVSRGTFKNTLIVDELVDSGKTAIFFMKKGYDVAAVYGKKGKIQDTLKESKKLSSSLFIEKVLPDTWLNMPHEAYKSPIENNIVRLFQYIGENPNREGILETPKRVIKMYDEIFAGYRNDPPKVTVFNNGKDGIEYDQMITDSGSFNSTCEHHMLPFFGDYFFAYLPGKKIIGLSKVKRVIDHCSKKMQIQERLVKEIVDIIEAACKPRGIALIMKAQHMCKTIRGVKDSKGEMMTSELRGAFLKNQNLKNEFLTLFSNR